MNAIRLRLPVLALACAAAFLIIAFSPPRRIAEARRQAAPTPAPTTSSALSPAPAPASAAPTPAPTISSALSPASAAPTPAPAISSALPPASPAPTPAPAISSALSPESAAQPSPQASDPLSASDSASPSALADGRRRHGRSSSSPAPSPSPTPTSPAFSSLDGYWEVVVQTPSDNFYSRFDLHQSADALTGVWTRDGKKLPMEGTFGGRQFKLVAKNDEQTLTLTGYVENSSDMVGIVDDETKKTRTAFTASHHAAYRTNNFLPKRGEKRGS